MKKNIMSSDISIVNEKHKELHETFLQIFNGRSHYQISNFVVGSHCTLERQYDQCVTELQAKYYNIRHADISRRKLIQEISEMSEGFDKEEKELELEQLEIAIISNIREFDYLYSIFKSMPKFTAEQLQEAESKYWLERLSTQAQIDLDATGRVSAGNYEALRQIDMLRNHDSRFIHFVKDHPGVNDKIKTIAKEIEENTNKE